MSNEKGSISMSLPISIILAGIIIAGAIFMVNSDGSKQIAKIPTQEKPEGNTGPTPVNKEDHILGNPDAEIVFVGFSDLECSFCKVFHSTMQDVMDVYGKDGKVAWVFRHFPLSFHQKALPEALATECAAELGGNQTFWDYTDKIMEVTPSNDGFDLSLLPEIAEEFGLDKADFQKCLDEERHSDKIATFSKDARNSGAQGTPFSVILTKDGKKYPMSGALSFSFIQNLVDLILAGGKENDIREAINMTGSVGQDKAIEFVQTKIEELK